MPAWIGAAYWFTASTSIEDPAITAGRALSDTFSGSALVDAPGLRLSLLVLQVQDDRDSQTRTHIAHEIVVRRLAAGMSVRNLDQR